MNLNKKKALYKHRIELSEAVEPVIQPFLNYLIKRELIKCVEKEEIDAEKTSEAKLIKLLSLIKAKDNGWEAIISYLKSNQHGILADNLENSVKENGNAPCKTAVSGFIQDFSAVFKQQLKEFYIAEYSRVPTMFNHHKHVNDVWVPLRIDEKTGNHKQKDPFDHIELQRRLGNPRSPHVAVVKGDPGMGKTTLVKKIAYDWATGKCNDFSLILAVPLRYVGSTRDFLELAAQYYTNRLQRPKSSMTNLLSWLIGLGRKLLICLDGLDEYASLAQSPLVNLFTEKFQKSTRATTNSEAPLFSYQLLITSRPYACDINHRSFFALRFEISSLDANHLADFIRLYCATDDGKAKVSKYVEENKKLVIAVPLILMFVCYLADISEEIPTNLTLLYEKLVYNMLTREVVANKIADEIDNDSWKDSTVVKSTAKLAFDGCRSVKFEFPQSVQNSFCVTEDSFISGFLLHKFNFEKEELTGEFPHRSIQEFFAALHVYQLISSAKKDSVILKQILRSDSQFGSFVFGISLDELERNTIMKEILMESNEFGRFFFGICSGEKKFDEMVRWLNPTFADAEMIEKFSFDPHVLLNILSASLSDCSEAEAKLLGQRLAPSLEQLEKKIKVERNQKIYLRRIGLSSLNQSFQSGLHLNLLDNNSIPNWSVSHIDNQKWSRLVYAFRDPPVDLREKFDKIQIFIWTRAPIKAGMISSLDRLPPVSTLIIQTYHPIFEVNFDLNYKMTPATTATSAATQLRHFTFGFLRQDIPPLKGSLLGELSTDDLIIVETRKTGEKREISWLTVTVSPSLDQIQLVRMLVRLAFEVAVAPQNDDGITVGRLEAKRKVQKCGLM